jgi:hypothetical protein
MHMDNKRMRECIYSMFLILVCVSLCSSMANKSFAGSVTTLDGKRIEGEVAIDSPSVLRVTPKSGSPTRVELSNLLEAEMDVPEEPAMTRGVVLTDGTALAAATFRRADAETVKLVPTMMNAEVSIKAVRVAFIVFGSTSSELLSKVPRASTGVLLDSGDFVEGEFVGLENGKVKISSVLFGIQAFDAGRPARAVVLRDAKPAAGAWVARLSDGSVLPADAIVLDRDKTLIEKTPFGSINVPFEQIAQISGGGDRIVSLTALKPVVPPREPSPVPAALSLIGATRSGTRAIYQPASTTLDYNLAAGYESFIAEVGVPAGLVPTQIARITILGDGKELFRSDGPRTSVDDALPVALNVRGVITLRLKIESTSPAAPVAWLDPILVKTSD